MDLLRVYSQDGKPQSFREARAEDLKGLEDITFYTLTESGALKGIFLQAKDKTGNWRVILASAEDSPLLITD